VIVLLSILLAGFMFWTLREDSPQTSTPSEDVVLVDAGAYQADLSNILQTFDERFSSAENDGEKLVVAETALASLLLLRVPVEYKDLHIELAVAFNQIQTALKGEEPSAVESLLAKIEVLRGEYSWLVQ